MRHRLMAGIAGGALAVALALGGATAAGAAPGGAAVAAAAAERPGGRERGPAQRLAGALIRATAEVTGQTPEAVRDGLRAGKSLEQIAQDGGKTAADVLAAARARLEAALAAAVSSGRLTQQRADALLQRFDQGAPQVVSDAALGQKAALRLLARRHPAAAALVQATAQVTGLTAQEVLDELRDGKSLAQVAQDNGKTVDDILARLREQGQQRLDRRQERARQLLEQPGLGQ